MKERQPVKDTDATVSSLEDKIPYIREQRRKKANRRLIYVLILIGLLIAVVFYLQSSYSRVATLEIDGVVNVKEADIIQASRMKVKETHAFNVSEEAVLERIEDVPGIREATMTQSFLHNYQVNIVEEKEIAYAKDQPGDRIVLADGTIIPGKSKEELFDAPILTGFTDQSLERLTKELVKIEPKVRSRISEIVANDKTDKGGLKLFMTDGNTVLLSTSAFSNSLNEYVKVISALPKGKTGTITIDGGIYFKPYKVKK
ncbi:cell division protein FtsQ/DivIB [Exiguobacterium oxidotolerans]|uniref:cell division protein FtsQ/DivIB n=1 Tax=Exiguobacterium oxidotolerans TaxID=223958 RepID=UPI000493C3A2|nr:cell division protein FtsQ/DivIB [Exiguobacterium oxidotolerans]